MEGFEHRLCLGRPLEFPVLSQECGDRCCNLAEIVYKAVIKVGEAEKYTNVVYRLGYWPGGDSGDLRGVHLDTLGANDKPEEGDFLYMELAFAQFQDQVGLPEPFQN